MDEIENTCFRDPAWLQSFPLTRESVLDYFALSQFYDRNCNNEVLKMQTQHSELRDLEGLLRKMSGVQYAVHHAEEPHLFVIRKCRRLSEAEAVALDFYYVIHGSVYQAPTERDLVGTRVTNTLFALTQALGYQQAHRARSTPPPTAAQSMAEARAVPFSRMMGLVNSYHTDYPNIPDSSEMAQDLQ